MAVGHVRADGWLVSVCSSRSNKFQLFMGHADGRLAMQRLGLLLAAVASMSGAAACQAFAGQCVGMISGRDGGQHHVSDVVRRGRAGLLVTGRCTVFGRHFMTASHLHSMPRSSPARHFPAASPAAAAAAHYKHSGISEMHPTLSPGSASRDSCNMLMSAAATSKWLFVSKRAF